MSLQELMSSYPVADTADADDVSASEPPSTPLAEVSPLQTAWEKLQDNPGDTEFQERVFQALVASERSAAGQDDDDGGTRRVRIKEPIWNKDDPILQEVLAFWQSPQSTLGGHHPNRLAQLQRFLAHQQDGAEEAVLSDYVCNLSLSLSLSHTHTHTPTPTHTHTHTHTRARAHTGRLD